MWLFTKWGFFSVVRIKNQPDSVFVRARVKQDLMRLKARYCLVNRSVKIFTDKFADYPYRIVLTQDEFAEVMVKAARDIDYNNFKDQVEVIDGKPRAKLYTAIWSHLYGAEKKLQLQGGR